MPVVALMTVLIVGAVLFIAHRALDRGPHVLLALASVITATAGLAVALAGSLQP